MDSELKTVGDREGVFRQWLDRHAGLILKVVRGCTATPQDQDDLFQDILLQLFLYSVVSRGIKRNDLDLSRGVQYRAVLATHRTSATPQA